ncbi:MAG: transporter [Frondihabitans sp.]|nr:transporter [Frondihabitans sp.]
MPSNSTTSSRGRGVFLDLRPLRANPVFRRFWIGALFSAFGSQIASFALLYYVWSRTHDSALVGLIGLAQFVPLLVFALVGGHLADGMDRRRLVLVARVGQLVVSAGLAVAVIHGTHTLVPVYLLIALQSALSSVAAPASKAFLPRILAPDQLGPGLALTNLEAQAALLASPLVAGLAIAAWGVDGCFLFDTLTFVAAIYGVFGLPSMPAPAAAAAATRGAHSLLAGVRLVIERPVLAAAFLADLSATVLAMPVALFPVINSEKFGGSPVTLGLFLPALAVGGVVAGALSGRVSHARKPGWVMLVAGLGWALGLAAFGAINVLWIAIPCLAIAGASDAVSVIARGTIVQRGTPDEFRGRVNALDYVVGAGGPQIGNIRAGLVAAATSGSTSMVVGGLAAGVGTVLIGILTPSLRRFRQEPEVVGSGM